MAGEIPPLSSLLVDAGPRPPDASGGGLYTRSIGSVEGRDPSSGRRRAEPRAAGADRMGVVRRLRMVCGQGVHVAQWAKRPPLKLEVPGSSPRGWFKRSRWES